MSMLIRDLFQKDIARPINGVVMADQLDDVSIWQELDEYVVTKELDRHLWGFFDSYLATIRDASDPKMAGKIGVWVSGFFGSGKSHFIKILSYLLQNREVTANGATRRAVEFFEDKIGDPMLFADIQRAVRSDTDVILFNIDSKANPQDGRGAILAVFLRVFNEMLGFSGDHPHIARMERYLMSQGKLGQFHQAFKAAKGSEWLDERDAYEFNQEELIAALSQVLRQTEEASRQWLERAETSFPLTPENFARWVKEYLDSRGPEHRIIFLIDEIGRFIGDDTHLMLSLQTIVENLGTVCGGRAWVVVTSQENIEAVLGEVKASKANDFSTIQGRFKTRLSLSSANTDEVIQRRLLSKTETAERELNAVYTSQGDILKNQLSFTNLGMTFKRLDAPSTFVTNYPFVPYQFQLVQKVFEVIRKHGATGLHLSRGERSMLDAFQLAGRAVANHEVGALVPLYSFYPSIESFLDTGVKRTIDQAIERGLEPFDVEILRVLFLVRYVDEFKSNVDNLVTLCIDKIDTDRLALRRKIEESLQRLERETLISRNGEDYFFLTNEERDVSREIKDVELNGGEEARKLGELIFEGVLKGNTKHRYPVNKKDFGFNRFCDGHPIGSVQSANDLIVSVITPLADDYDLYHESRCIMESSTDDGKLLIKLDNSESLGRELRLYLQTEKYIRRKSDDSLPHTTKRILSDRAEENRDRERRLIETLEQMIVEADYYVAGQTRTVKPTSAASAISNELTYLVENTFSKLSYLKALKESADACRMELQAVLCANDIGQQALGIQAEEANEQALADLRDYIDLSTRINRQIVLQDLVDRYSRRPYGWPEFEIILLLGRLIVSGEISIVADGATVSVERAYEPLTKPARWRSISAVKRRTVDAGQLQKARKLGLDVFGEMGPDSEEGFFAFCVDKLTRWRESLRQYKTLADTGRYPGGDAIADALKLIGALAAERNSFDFIEKLAKHRADLCDLSESYHELVHFYEHQKPTWDRLRTATAEFGVNRSELEKDQAASAALSAVEAILKAPSPYGMIKDADGLIQQVGEVNASFVELRRQRALEKIDAHIDEVEREIARAGVSNDVSHRCLYPLQQQRSKVQAEPNIGNIQLLLTESTDLADQAIDLLERAVREKEEAEQPKGADEHGHIRNELVGERSQKRYVLRPTRIVKPIELTTKPYLETEADVQEFLGALAATLNAALQANERIRIR